MKSRFQVSPAAVAGELVRSAAEGCPAMLWQFETSPDADEFCRDIVREMVTRFPPLSDVEAVALVNRLWRGDPFTHEHDLRYHRPAEVWAKHIHDFVPQLIRSHGP